MGINRRTFLGLSGTSVLAGLVKKWEAKEENENLIPNNRDPIVFEHRHPEIITLPSNWHLPLFPEVAGGTEDVIPEEGVFYHAFCFWCKNRYLEDVNGGAVTGCVKDGVRLWQTYLPHAYCIVYDLPEFTCDRYNGPADEAYRLGWEVGNEQT